MANVFKKSFWKKLPGILVATFNGFLDDKGLKLSAALAYYTIFSIGPLLLLVMALAGIFLQGRDVSSDVFSQLNGLLGPSAAKQIEEIIAKLNLTGKSTFALIISVVTLVIGATSLFVEIQDSLNIIWKLKAKPKKSWLAFLKNRLLSSSLIISIGFLMIVTLIVNGVIDVLMHRLDVLFGKATPVLMLASNLFITFLVITVLFSIIFKFLPDARIQWKHVRTGAVFTAIMFMLGRYLIGLYIQKTGTESAYGAAGSIVIILIWIYYSSVILYMGAEFTRCYTDASGDHIEPADYAVRVEQTEIEKVVKVLPHQRTNVNN